VAHQQDERQQIASLMRFRRKHAVGSFVLAVILAAFAGVFMMLIEPVLGMWMRHLPENIEDRAVTLAAGNHLDEALELLDFETRRRMYNFNAYFLKAELCIFSAPDDGMVTEGLHAIMAAFDRSFAVRNRDRSELVTLGWNEPRALALLSMQLARLGRIQEASLLAATALDLAPFRSRLTFEVFARKFTDRWTEVRQEPVPPVSSGQAPGIALWSASDADAIERLVSWGTPELGMRLEPASDDGASAGLVFTRRTAIRLELDNLNRAQRAPVTLILDASATPAFGAWPVLLVRTVDDKGATIAALGATSVRGKQSRRYVVGPFDLDGEALEIWYVNDEYDADRKEDRNLVLHAISVVVPQVTSPMVDLPLADGPDDTGDAPAPAVTPSPTPTPSTIPVLFLPPFDP
jgi:hypothetical protein